ncbi:hypothetical protein CCP1ISM_1040001 [Azospirillaceae bacterium]
MMSCRQTGMAMLASSTVQEAQDLALVVHAATLRSRLPFIHFFDGFRTSHEINGVVPLIEDEMRQMLDPAAITAHRRRALSPDAPVLRGTAQNPDVFFQAREAANPYYDACPAVVQEVMDELGRITGRHYRLFDYDGHPEAERVIIAIGSGAETARETAIWLAARGERVGVITVRLYRPFSIADFVTVLPASTRSIAVLDRTKEPGAVGDPLYLDVVAALAESAAAEPARFARAPAGNRRPLRPVVEGIHPRHGEGGVRRIESRAAEAPLHGRHHRRCRPQFADRRRRPRHHGRGHHPDDVLRPGGRRHRRCQQELAQDHRRRTGGAGSGLLRL